MVSLQNHTDKHIIIHIISIAKTHQSVSGSTSFTSIVHSLPTFTLVVPLVYYLLQIVPCAWTFFSPHVVGPRELYCFIYSIIGFLLKLHDFNIISEPPLTCIVCRQIPNIYLGIFFFQIRLFCRTSRSLDRSVISLIFQRPQCTIYNIDSTTNIVTPIIALKNGVNLAFLSRLTKAVFTTIGPRSPLRVIKNLTKTRVGTYRYR